MLKKLKKIARLALQGVFLGQLKKQDLLNNKKKGKKKGFMDKMKEAFEDKE